MASPGGKKVDIGAIIIAQQMNDIVRANNDLTAMKNFRVQNEKFYKDKELQMIRRKEIREPLEEALTNIDILTERLDRRDDMIDKLRRHITIDSLQYKQNSMEEAKSRAEELKDNERRVEVLLDQMSAMNKSADIQASQLIRCKKTIKFQVEKTKDLSATNEKLEFYYKEKIRKFENERDSMMSLLGMFFVLLAQCSTLNHPHPLIRL
jgi:hypothetical protein